MTFCLLFSFCLLEFKKFSKLEEATVSNSLAVLLEAKGRRFRARGLAAPLGSWIPVFMSHLPAQSRYLSYGVWGLHSHLVICKQMSLCQSSDKISGNQPCILARGWF